MIRILFLIETLSGGGAEKVLRDLVNNMDRTRFDITVMTVWPCETEKLLAEGIHYRSMYPKQNEHTRKLLRVEAELGLAYPLRIGGGYDIECAFLETAATKILAGSTNKNAVKLAWVHCDLLKAVSDPRGFAEKTKKQYAKFDTVLCVSQNVKNSFVTLFGDTVPAEVLYNTVDDAEIRKKASEPLPDGITKRRLTAVSLGRLSEPKCFERLLAAHKKLLDEGLAHDLWIIGEGPKRAKLEALIRENGLEDSVRLPGFFANPYPFLREADLAVCSSGYEGFSTFITECTILGKPTVTTDCGGMREILGDSEYGLITENSGEGVYEGMKKMLSDSKLRESFAEKARLRGQSFSMGETVRNTEKFFVTKAEEKKH